MQQIQGVIPQHGDFAVSEAGAAVSITYPAVKGKSHWIFLIDASYSATPTGGNLHMHRGGTDEPTIMLDLDVPGTFVEVGYHMPIRSNVGESLTITLAGGGGDVIGKLSVEHYLG